MKAKALAVALVLGLAGLGLVAVAAPAGAADAAGCTLSYPATCTVSAGGQKVHCSNVGAVPDCRT